MLNISPTTMVFTIINLLILFFILRKFLFKPINNIIAKREEEMKAAEEEIRKREEETIDLKAQLDEQLANIEDEKTAILADTNAKAAIEYDKIVNAAKDEAAVIIDDATKKAIIEQERVKKAAEGQIADIVVQATEKMLAGTVSEEENRELYEKFLNKAGGSQ
ncbi:MAG: hypothetical protein K6F99_08400 [Lachnospiraceae bacterium]|nr:hypothetical protein [Lachnospiraceae bacterium]